MGLVLQVPVSISSGICVARIAALSRSIVSALVKGMAGTSGMQEWHSACGLEVLKPLKCCCATRCGVLKWHGALVNRTLKHLECGIGQALTCGSLHPLT
jgi:hypothetical protein